MTKLQVDGKLAKYRWRYHRKHWQACEACPLHNTRTRVVFARGTIPADILFIGEAPGESEDVLGVPFIGPAGKLLDELIERSGLLRPYAITNLVCCMPNAADNGEIKLRPPTKEEAGACKSRLMDFIKIANPSIIITLGATAKTYLPKFNLPEGITVVDLIHPAAILRMSDEKKTLTMKRFILGIKKAIKRIKKGSP